MKNPLRRLHHPPPPPPAAYTISAAALARRGFDPALTRITRVEKVGLLYRIQFQNGRTELFHENVVASLKEDS